MSSDVVVGIFTLLGVALGYGGNLALEVRRERRDSSAAEQELMAAARHVWQEISDFETATDTAAQVPPAATRTDLVLDLLTSREQLRRYSDVLARHENVDFAAIQRAYEAARFAAATLAGGLDPREVQGLAQPELEAGLRAVAAIARLDPAPGSVPELAEGEGTGALA